ncbi:histidine kinase [Cellulomonas sp.]|uniref:sensor histidine kinase n=1 Tax=Cellulomonas sp. TaxID=40001 RepID=UPI001B1622F4|nr:histidine kinase [Cellulomonas sp.]MBO9553992.1 two-component sensor histidine kinase [Cellulomonas sp.]
MRTRALTWWRGRPVLFRDACGSAVLLVVALLNWWSDGFRPGVSDTLLVLAGVVAVAWRRVAVVPVLVVTGVATVAATSLVGTASGTFLPVLVAVYSAAAWGHRVAGAVTAAAVALGASVAAEARSGAWDGTEVVAITAVLAIAVAIGLAVGSRREFIAVARERAERLEESREVEAARRVTEERLRIARELHDVVGHHVAVIGVQAGVAEAYLRSRPDYAQDALGHVQDAAESVLTELRALVSVLRTSDGPDERAPVPGLADLDELLDRVGDLGLTVTVARSGDGGPLAPLVDLIAFRVVQESLTNAHKHGDGRAFLTIERQSDALNITVTNGIGRTGGTTAGGGFGLTGLRERVTSVGGTLDAGPSDHGFRLHATLPSLTGAPTKETP